MADTEQINRLLLCVLCLFQCSLFVKFANGSNVIQFEASKTLEQIEERISVLSSRVRRDLRGDGDAQCQKQENDFLQELKSGKKIDIAHTFENETRYAMALAWAGENDGTLIVVTTETRSDGSAVSSKVYRSSNYGANFTDISSQVNNVPIRKHSGVQRHPKIARRLYLIYESLKSSQIFITLNGGETFDAYKLNFDGSFMDGEMVFNNANDDYMLAITDKKDLFVSKDNAQTWEKILANVHITEWGIIEEDDTTASDKAYTVYALTLPSNFDPVMSLFVDPVYSLRVTDDCGQKWTTLLEGVIRFSRAGRYLSATVLKNPKDSHGIRLLKVSTDRGKTWREAILPTIEPDRFYSVMDMEDNMIFMHVDNPEDTGHGVLYTSSLNGIIYSESLRKHLYPNGGSINDFYKVKSMRGVYMTSQMNDDDSIHSMITYNRGATWQNIPRPEGAPCKNESKECYLQIHGMYSLQRGIKALLPMSEESAPGIILAHGHVADALQTTDPDVFVSSNGGYTWRLALKGPHHYQIGDHGGLLVAVPFTDNHPKIVKFSTDEGRCWHEYQFTKDLVNNTGLLAEPGGQSSVVGIWGFTSDTRKWRVHVIDFKNVIPRPCKPDDYEVWMPHMQQRKEEGTSIQGCLLGLKETFQRIKKDSWCYNGYEKELESSRQTCKCTREDYECEYGFHRPKGSDDCVKIPEFKGPDVDICLRGHLEKIATEGYRIIPGDSCTDGFKPTGKLIDLDKHCVEGDKSIVKMDETGPVLNHASKTILVVIVCLVLLVAVVLLVYFIRKYAFLQRHKVEYKYSFLNQADQEVDLENHLENAISPAPSLLYHDSDEEEELTTSTHSTTRMNGSMANRDNHRKNGSVAFKAYHDDSDDDLLS